MSATGNDPMLVLLSCSQRPFQTLASLERLAMG